MQARNPYTRHACMLTRTAMLMCWQTWLLATCSFPRLGTASMRLAVMISLHADKHAYNRGHNDVGESSHMHHVKPMWHHFQRLLCLHAASCSGVALPSALQDALPAKERLMQVIYHVQMSYFAKRLVLRRAGCCSHLLLKLKLLSNHIHLAMLAN